MGIKTYRPYTPSRRHMTGSDFSEITKATPTDARHSIGTILISPEGRRSVAYFPSLAMSCALFPGQRTINTLRINSL